jgi:hypothetical protein
VRLEPRLEHLTHEHGRGYPPPLRLGANAAIEAAGMGTWKRP